MPDRIMPLARTWVLANCVTLALATGAFAANDGRPARLEIWDIKLGTQVERLPDEFVDYACGNNGGPPALPLAGWRDFKRCRPEPSGLREIYFRYDDELEYWARANNLIDQMEQYAGTKTYGFPIVASTLIDADGVAKGIRIVSDPRYDNQNRDEAYLLKNFLTARFGREGWTCENLSPEAGETPFDGNFIKSNCRKQIDAQTTASLSTRHLRKPGQQRFDPQSGRETTGQFESSVRFELQRDK